MYCQLSKNASYMNFSLIKKSLRFDTGDDVDEYSAEAWNNSWDSVEDVQATKSSETDDSKDNLWLQNCVLSLSPTLDIVAFAHNQYSVFLSAKYDVNEKSNIKHKFVTTFEGMLVSDKNIKITSLLCLPLASQKKSLQGGVDWTCIIVGYSSGFVKIYTERGELLLSQILHEEPVTHLKYKTHPTQHFQDYSDQSEELIIVYSSSVVTIDGFGLFQTLRACRNQLARVSAGKKEVTHSPPLTYKKWGFSEHSKFAECEAYGSLTVPIFDHLVTESVRKGFYGSVKTNLIPSTLLVSIGSNPYVGFYYATEGRSQMLITDVVQAVASKLMNFISSSNAGGLIGGLIGRSETDPSKNKPKIEPPTVLPLRFGLYDKRRQGLSVILSPNKALAVISDVFGRVILFDVLKGVAVRMWKGYRDAQCGWVGVEEEDKKSRKDSNFAPNKKKRMFFVVIYAPRRGILEVWCSQQGPRVGAFNVGKSGRLLSPGYAMVGANFSSLNLTNPHLSACYFLSNGYLKRVIVPSSICSAFPLSLSERNSKRFRDLQLLKDLKTVLKSISEDKNDEVIKIMKSMKTPSIQLQALNNLCSNRFSSATLMEGVMLEVLSHLEKHDSGETDYEMKLLKQSCLRIQQLVNLYKLVCDINSKAIDQMSSKASSDSKETPLDVQLYASSFCTSEGEIARMLSLVAIHQQVASVVKKQVRFSDDGENPMAFSDFMSFFNVTDCQLQRSGDEVTTKNLSVDVKSNLTDKDLENLGFFLFYASVFVGGCHSSLQSALKDSGILPEKLARALFGFWLSSGDYCDDARKWLNLQQTLKHISSLCDAKIVCSDSENVSSWWKSIRDILALSSSNSASYIGAFVARSVAAVMAATFHAELKNTVSGNAKSSKSADGRSDSGDSDWEAISLDMEQWDFLVKQLEEVLMLSMLLKSQPLRKTHIKKANISVEMLLNAGQGAVSDLVAVWAVSTGLQADLLSSYLLCNSDEEGIFLQQRYDDDTKMYTHVLTMIKGVLTEVRKKFPYSLSHDVLLANCAWEHLMQWNLDKENVSHLTQSLSCFDLIQSSVVKNGFASMMWKTCVQAKFESLALLIEKVGKTPKERLCRKDLEMGDTQLESFLDFCCQLLNIILETNLAAEVEEVPEYQSEEFWLNRESQGPTHLILMALGQKVFNTESVYQHLMLSTVLHLIVTFQMKNSRPLGLFNSLTRKTFFGEMHLGTKSKPDKNEVLEPSRTQFLLHAATAIAQSVAEIVPEASSDAKKANDRSSPPGPEAVGNDVLCSRESFWSASKWFNKVIDLGRDWEVNLDVLRRHFVCELYSGGHDVLAEEVMSAVTEKTLLASQLLLLCGQRIHHLVFESSETANRLSFLSPDLAAWLKSLERSKLRCNNVPLQGTKVLTNHILAFLPERSREAKLAQSIQDALGGFLQNQKNTGS